MIIRESVTTELFLYLRKIGSTNWTKTVSYWEEWKTKQESYNGNPPPYEKKKNPKKGRWEKKKKMQNLK